MQVKFGAAMEALRTKIDGLQWEVQRLSTENRRLKEDHSGLSDLIDREEELESTKGDVAELTGPVQTLEQQLAEKKCAAENAESRAERAET